MSQDHRVNLHPAFVLHSRPYRDTSRLLDVFAREYGRVTLVAKGTRNSRSKTHGLLEVFTPLLISWSGKGDVQTLTGVESLKNNIQLSGKLIMSGFYLNEILQRLLTSHDPHPEVFDSYQTTLEQMGKSDEETLLRNFEKSLLAEIGYGLNLATDIESGKKVVDVKEYLFDIEKGPIEIKIVPEHELLESETFYESQVKVRGKTLLELAHGSFHSDATKQQAKQLMRIIIAHYLGDKPLKTRDMSWYKPL